jgi:hypothetical protein
MNNKPKTGEQKSPSPVTSDERFHNKSEYRAPLLVTLGKTVDLVQQNSVGQFLDGAAVVTRSYT